MVSRIGDPLLARLSEFVAERIGLYFPRERWKDLERGIISAARESGAKDPESFIRGLLSPSVKREQIEILASFLTVGESYFFRDERSFGVLEQHILPKWIDSRRNEKRRLRIWSAGCATGEEPYSIAILLTRMIPDLKDWEISILATDINPRFLYKATEGVYSEWSFRDVPVKIKKRYFRKTRENRYRISPDIQKMVAFSCHNLAEDNHPSVLHGTVGMDLIFCRNVIMYFAEEVRRKVIRNLYHCLAEGGCLVVSPAEISHTLFSEYVTTDFPGVAIFRKDSSKSHRPIDFAAEKIEALPSNEHASALDGSDIRQAEIEPLAETGSGRPVSPAKRGIEEALSLCGLGQYPEAEKRIFEILSLNPQDPKALGLLSRAKANQGNLAEALEWCEKVIAVDKLNPESHYLRATILQEQGEVEAAVLSLKKALYLNPDFVPAHFVLGNLFRQQGKQKDSKRHFRNALALLRDRRQDELVAESEGISAGRLAEIIRSIVPEFRIDDL